MTHDSSINNIMMYGMGRKTHPDDSSLFLIVLVRPAEQKCELRRSWSYAGRCLHNVVYGTIFISCSLEVVLHAVLFVKGPERYRSQDYKSLHAILPRSPGHATTSMVFTENTPRTENCRELPSSLAAGSTPTTDVSALCHRAINEQIGIKMCQSQSLSRISGPATTALEGLSKGGQACGNRKKVLEMRPPLSTKCGRWSPSRETTSDIINQVLFDFPDIAWESDVTEEEQFPFEGSRSALCNDSFTEEDQGCRVSHGGKIESPSRSPHMVRSKALYYGLGGLGKLSSPHMVSSKALYYGLGKLKPTMSFMKSTLPPLPTPRVIAAKLA
jgi:hypothetical protein